ncbi:MAG: hypothetical protein GY786_12315 [Proteobacteria bacterium]|nr:hypothetical protein [Pseudomonadota bacterium]
MVESDRRHFPRQNEETAIQVLLAPNHSNGRKDSYDLLPAKLYNQSEEGLYIEIDHTLRPGSTLSIKMASPVEDHPEDAYYMYDGRVIWCKKVNEKTSRFGGGVKIVRKVVRADVLTSRF